MTAPREPRAHRPRADAEHVPVLVVGAGPAGLTAAVTLARAGIECLLVDRRPGVSSLPRATVASTGTMELLRSWGLDDEIRAGSNDAEMQMLVCRTLAEASAGTAFPVGYPTRSQSSVISPATPLCVPQDHVETVLLDHLATLP